MRKKEKGKRRESKSEYEDIRHPVLYAFAVAAAAAVISAAALYGACRLLPPYVLPWVRDLIADGSWADGTAGDAGAPAGNGQMHVPDLAGMTRAEASESLNALSLGAKCLGETVSNLPAGVVTDQDPAPRTAVEANTTVFFHTSAGPAELEMPGLAGEWACDAVTALKEAGFTDISIKAQPSDETASGAVIRTEPAAGAEVSTADAAVLFVSTGAGSEPFEAGDYLGMASGDALRAAAEDGFIPALEYGKSDTAEKGTVFRQSVPEGLRCTPGDGISLVVSTGVPDKLEGGVEYLLAPPDNYTGAPYRLVLLSEGPDGPEERVICEGSTPGFPMEMAIPCAGTLRYDEKLGAGGYVPRASWDVPEGTSGGAAESAAEIPGS